MMVDYVKDLVENNIQLCYTLYEVGEATDRIWVTAAKKWRHYSLVSSCNR